MAKELEFLFRGSAKMRGVVFYVNAKSAADAQVRARAGQYDDVDLNAAEMTDWDIEPQSIESNHA